MSAWHLRPAAPSDYAGMAAIFNRTSFTPTTAAELEREDRRWAQAGPSLRLAALDPAGRMAGHGWLFRDPWRPAGTFTVRVAVDPDAAGQGAGTALLGALEEQARGCGATVLDSAVRDDRPADLAWAGRRGFAVIDRYFKSELDLQRFDPAPFRLAIDRAEAAGYRFITLADVDPEIGRRGVYDLDMDCAQDEPGINKGSWPPVTYEEYGRQMFDPALFDPAGVVVAVKDGEWAAMSALHFPPDRPTCYVFFTGVRRAHRGHGLAQATKLLAGERARARSCERIATGNHERNPAMLAVNRKFGFQPLPGIYILQKPL